MEIEKLLQEFDLYAKESQGQLKEMLSTISEGRVPSCQDVSRLDVSIASLREKYYSVFQAASDQLSDDEMPGENKPVFEYADAIKNSKTIQLKQRLNEAKNCLQRFLSVRSLVEAYTNALSPLQQQAALFLETIETDDISLEDVDATAAGPRALLAAIDCTDKDSSEGIALCDQVAEYYPGRVYSGVVANKYFVDEEFDSYISESTPEAENCKDDASEFSPCTNDSLFEKKSSETVPVMEETTESKFAEELHAHSCFISDINELGNVGIEKNSSESKKISSNIFVREMREGNLPIEKIIVRSLDGRNVVTAESLITIYGIPENLAEYALSYMTRKGYLYKYNLTTVGSIYCASSRLKKALTYKDACKCVDVKQRSVSDWGDLTAEEANCVASRIALSKLHSRTISRLFAQGINRTTEFTSNRVDSFIERIHNADDPSGCELNTGIFWVNSDDCENYLTDMNDTISELGQIKSFTLSAWDVAKAKSLADILLSFVNKSPCEFPVYLHSLSNNAFYSYPSLEVLKDEIPAEDDKNLPLGNEPLPEEAPTSDDIVSTLIEEQEPDDSGDEVTGAYAAEEIASEELLPHTDDSDNAISVISEKSSEEAINVNLEDEANTDIDLVHYLLYSKITPSDDELLELIKAILSGEEGRLFNEDSHIAQALLLSKAASFSDQNKKCTSLYKQLLLATRSPLDDVIYSANNLSDAFNYPCSPTILLSAYLLAMLTPATAYDYGLRSQIEGYSKSFDIYFPELLDVKPLFTKLKTIQDVIPGGFTDAILARLGSDSQSEKYLATICTRAKGLFSVSTPKTRMKALPSLYNACFGKSSDMYHCLEIVANNTTAEVGMVKLYLEDFCNERNGVFSIDENKIEDVLDGVWFEVNGQGSSFTLEYAARQQALRQFSIRLEVLKEWFDHTSILPDGEFDFARLKGLKGEINDLTEQVLVSTAEKQIEFKCVLVCALKAIKQHLGSSPSISTNLFSELAQTGIISLNDEWLPILSKDLDSVKYCEPWRSVLRHIASPVESLEMAKDEILNGGEHSDLFDNLRQLEKIGELTGEQLKSTEEQIRSARKTAADNSKDFDDSLELAFTYNRITETEKENLAAIKRQHEESLLERKDFGIWRQFLLSLQHRIDELTEKRKFELKGMLDSRLSKVTGEEPSILKAAQRLLEEDLNFAVTEEYINRYDNGEMQFSKELESTLHDEDYFSNFISDEVFTPIYDECIRRKDINFHNVAKEYLSRHFPQTWTTRLKEDSLRFVGGKESRSDKYWPIRKNTTTPTQIKELFNWLGMTVTHANKVNGKSDEMFVIDVTASPRSMADYRHPISLFGTQAKSQMNVIVLHGNNPAKQIVDKITGLGLGSMSIVILNYPITLAVRRQISEEFHKTTGQNPFILIDQVLVLYLALHQITERLPIMLKCTLPYTTYQPFVRDGGSTADEMFFGRSKELADIINPNGACVVYGGRQLGKTALLERAESLRHKPENRSFAVYSNIFSCDTEESMAQKVADDVRKKTGFVLESGKTISELCNEFERLFQTNQVESMLLLLDETDKFLGTISSNDYAQLQPLIDLKRRTKNNFKFVLAGLHNVCRAKNATERNGVFGQLGTPLCVKPLSPTDALQLLSRPLKYLGFQIDRYPHLETILTNTNYYPGILQFFGYMLVETLSTHYGRYYRAVDGNPPYTLQDDQLGAVMNSADLNRSIKDKFRWSLELDPRYFMIARCIAVLYYLSDETANTWLGFSVSDIKGVADSYKIFCLRNESERDYKNLLDEMVEMGILSRPNAERDLYRLRRSSFINIIGSDFDAVDADIEKNNLEDAQ